MVLLVPFHVHGPVWNEVFHGRKRWFVYPPDFRPRFDPDESQLHWAENVYPTLQDHELPLECTCEPGEALYLPHDWWHATLNLDPYTCFMATFCE